MLFVLLFIVVRREVSRLVGDGDRLRWGRDGLLAGVLKSLSKLLRLVSCHIKVLAEAHELVAELFLLSFAVGFFNPYFQFKRMDLFP